MQDTVIKAPYFSRNKISLQQNGILENEKNC
jgi:hypothetical protein